MPDDDYEDEATFWRDIRQQSAAGTRPPSRHDFTDDPQRLDAIRVRCRHCGAPIRSDCRNKITGKPLRHLPAHPIRVTDARKVPK